MSRIIKQVLVLVIIAKYEDCTNQAAAVACAIPCLSSSCRLTNRRDVTGDVTCRGDDLASIKRSSSNSFESWANVCSTASSFRSSPTLESTSSSLKCSKAPILCPPISSFLLAVLSDFNENAAAVCEHSITAKAKAAARTTWGRESRLYKIKRVCWLLRNGLTDVVEFISLTGPSSVFALK